VLNQHSTNGQEELDVFRRPGLQLDVESREEELGGGVALISGFPKS
jgi:hypothetical protein